MDDGGDRWWKQVLLTIEANSPPVASVLSEILSLTNQGARAPLGGTQRMHLGIINNRDHACRLEVSNSMDDISVVNRLAQESRAPLGTW